MDGGAIRSVQLFNDICGGDFLENTALITTMWDKCRDQQDIEECKETERDLINQYWHNLLRVRKDNNGARVVDITWTREVVKLDEGIGNMDDVNGAMYVRSDNRKETFMEIIRQVVNKKPVVPKLQKELQRGRILGDTTAGKGLRRALDEKERVFMGRMKHLEEKRKKLLEENKADSANRLEEQAIAEQQALEVIEKDREALDNRGGRNRARPKDGGHGDQKVRGSGTL